MRKLRLTHDRPAIRALVYLWIGQNVALVVSSIYRLAIYVEAYSLTYWRAAAFEWMALVALGLSLIVVRMTTRRSTRWLMSSNAAAAALVLYVSAFVNYSDLIARHNLRDGRVFDRDYVDALGPDAIRAVDAALASSPNPLLAVVRSRLIEQRRIQDHAWQAWTFRNWRLSRYLAEP